MEKDPRFFSLEELYGTKRTPAHISQSDEEQRDALKRDNPAYII